MTDDPATLRAERDAALAELASLKAQADPRTKVWTSTEIGNLTQAEYLSVQDELHRALREGRVRRDDVPAPRDPIPDRTAEVDAILAAADADGAARRRW